MEITKDQLKLALAEWEQLHRSGGCLSHAQAAEQPVEVVASTNAEYLWCVLSKATVVAQGE